MSRIAEPHLLHPAMQERSFALSELLAKEGIPLKRYETVRSPWRQALLFARGRTPGAGTGKVTKAKAWQSNHQYGLAEDRVFWINGVWTWDEPEPGAWAAYHALARSVDLLPLDFEKPHVELAWNLGALLKGHYPNGWEGSAWFTMFEDWAEKWGAGGRVESGQTHPGAPPLPDLGHRPELVG